MGSIIYGVNGISFDVEDRELAHLRTVIIAKLRRGESFAFTVAHGMGAGSGRTTLWMHQAIPLIFRFSGNRAPQLNRHWLQALSDVASLPDGLHLIPEPPLGSPGT